MWVHKVSVYLVAYHLSLDNATALIRPDDVRQRILQNSRIATNQWCEMRIDFQVSKCSSKICVLT